MALGILLGRPNPEGDRVHVMAVRARINYFINTQS